MTRKGKIARLPHALREQVNLRLLDGQTGPVILKWLNSQDDAKKIWANEFEGSPASAQNLSEWRLGGYKDWLRRRERADHLRTLSAFASDLARAGGSVADGAAAILGGHILEALEQAGNLAVTGGTDDAEKDPASGLAKMASAVASLQSAGVARARLELDKKRVRQKDNSLALDREKFESQTVAKFLDWAKSPEAAAILDSGKPRHVQMDALRALMFGRAADDKSSAA